MEGMSEVEIAIAALLREGVVISSDEAERSGKTRIYTFPKGDQYRLSDSEVNDLARERNLTIAGIEMLHEPIGDE
jgi:hypothetical protein